MNVDIIVCVHNSPDDVNACLTSVLPSLSSQTRLIIVDDGSAKETEDLCRAVAASQPDLIRLIRRPEGSGFARAANNGLRESTGDMVILLNSDTIVVGDWVERLKACMLLRPEIGIVGPLSNAASWQSVPEFRGKDGKLAVNPVPGDPAIIAQIHAACADFAKSYDYPFVEQVNGFCYGIRRSLLDTIGLFDEEAFPFGYGEENDFSFRAGEAGFVCAIAIDCFVYHAKTKSYSSERRTQLTEAGQAILRSRYGRPRLQSAVRSCQRHPVMSAIRERSRVLFRENGWLTS